MPAVDIPAAKRAGLPVDVTRLTRDGDDWLSPEERYALKTHGVCAQLQPEVFMIRVRTNGSVGTDAAGTPSASRKPRTASRAPSPRTTPGGGSAPPASRNARSPPRRSRRAEGARRPVGTHPAGPRHTRSRSTGKV